MTHDEVIAKIRKLAALANSPSVNEAAAAAASMSRLMHKYAIDQASLDTAPEQKYARSGPMFGPGISPWIYNLLELLVEVHRCGIIILNSNKYHVVGTTTEVQAVICMFKFLEREIKNLASESIKENKIRVGRRKNFRHNFAIGAVYKISTRLWAQKDKTERRATKAALARLDNTDELDSYLKELCNGKESRRRIGDPSEAMDSWAVECGSGAADRIDLGGETKRVKARADSVR